MADDVSEIGGSIKKTKTHVARQMNKPRLFTSEVDIIIPYHGQYDKVTELIESIFKFTRSNPYTIYVIDDYSPNSEYIQTIAKNANRRHDVLKALRCSEQKGFAGACQSAFVKGEAPYTCFINSDCRIEDIGWLQSMGSTLVSLKDQGIKMVSARTNNPVHPDEDSPQKGNKGESHDDVVLADDQYLSLYCFLCHRELFARCGGFLKSYPYGYYEDEEFAARMKKHGYKQAVSGSSWVYHEGGATIKSLWRKNPNIRTIMEEENRKRCIKDLKALK